MGKAEEVGDCWEDIHRRGRVFRDARFDSGGPFEDGGDAQAAFVNSAFVAAEITHGGGFDFGKPAVVAAEPDHGVVGDFEIAEGLAEDPDTAVEGDELGVVFLAIFIEILKGRDVFLACFERGVWRSIPDYSEEGLLRILLFFDEGEGLVDDDLRRVAFELMHTPGRAHKRIEIEEVGHGHPGLESKTFGAVGIFV